MCSSKRLTLPFGTTSNGATFDDRLPTACANRFITEPTQFNGRLKSAPHEYTRMQSLDETMTDLTTTTTDSDCSSSRRCRSDNELMRVNRSPPLTCVWEHVMRYRTLPSTSDMANVFAEIRERLNDFEWQVRQHALRVLADIMPTMEANVDEHMLGILEHILTNLGYSALAIRKAALEALVLYLKYTKIPEEVLRRIILDLETNPQTLTEQKVIAGIIGALPDLIFPHNAILDYPSMRVILECLARKILDPRFQAPAVRAMWKIRRIIGESRFVDYLKNADFNMDAFNDMSRTFDVDDRSVRLANECPGKVILKTEIQLNPEQSLTMTVCEENDDRAVLKILSDSDSSESNWLMLTPRTPRRVRFGGEVVKMRTPDSEGNDEEKKGNDEKTGNQAFENVDVVVSEHFPLEHSFLDKPNIDDGVDENDVSHDDIPENPPENTTTAIPDEAPLKMEEVLNPPSPEVNNVVPSPNSSIAAISDDLPNLHSEIVPLKSDIEKTTSSSDINISGDGTKINVFGNNTQINVMSVLDDRKINDEQREHTSINFTNASDVSNKIPDTMETAGINVNTNQPIDEKKQIEAKEIPKEQNYTNQYIPTRTIKPKKKPRSMIPLPIAPVLNLPKAVKPLKSVSEPNSPAISFRKPHLKVKHLYQSTPNLTRKYFNSVRTFRNLEGSVPPPAKLGQKKPRRADDAFSPLPIHEEIEVLHNLQKKKEPAPGRRYDCADDLKAMDDVDTETSSSGSGFVEAHDKDWTELRVVGDDVLAQILNKKDWKDRVMGREQLLSVMKTNGHALGALESRACTFLHTMLTYDRHTHVHAVTEEIIHLAIERFSVETLRECLPQLTVGLARIGPPAGIRLCVQLMHKLNPALVAEQFVNTHALTSKSTRLKENSLSTIMYTMLTFPNTEFNIPLLVSKVTAAISDPKRRVRQAVLETLAVLAHAAGPEIVKETVREVAKDSENSDAIFRAVKARLSRNTLPLIDNDYCIRMSALDHRRTADVDWINNGRGPISPKHARLQQLGPALLSTQMLDRFEANTTKSYFSGSFGGNSEIFNRTSIATSQTDLRPKLRTTVALSLEEPMAPRPPYSFQPNEPTFVDDGHFPPLKRRDFDKTGSFGSLNLAFWPNKDTYTNRSTLEHGGNFTRNPWYGKDAKENAGGIHGVPLALNTRVQRFCDQTDKFNNFKSKLKTAPPISTVYNGQNNNAMYATPYLPQITRLSAKSRVSLLANSPEHNMSIEWSSANVGCGGGQQLPNSTSNSTTPNHGQFDSTQSRFILEENGLQTFKFERRIDSSGNNTECLIIMQNDAGATPKTVEINNNHLENAESDGDDAKSESVGSSHSTYHIVNKQMPIEDDDNNSVNNIDSDFYSDTNIMDLRSKATSDSHLNRVYVNDKTTTPPTIQITYPSSTDDGDSVLGPKVETIPFSAPSDSSGSTITLPDKPEKKLLVRRHKSVPKFVQKSIVTLHGQDESVTPTIASLSLGDDLQRFDNVRESYQVILAQLNDSNDWETNVKGLKSTLRLIRFHPSIVENQIHVIVMSLSKHIRSLRSQVARIACVVAGELFVGFKKNLELDIEELASALLNRTADTNKFLRTDANAALTNLCVNNCWPQRVVQVICARGAGHHNAVVRCASARLLLNMLENLGVERVLCQFPRDVRDKFVRTSANLLLEGSLETRNYAKEIFRRMISYGGFERIMYDVVPATTLRNISKPIKSLK